MNLYVALLLVALCGVAIATALHVRRKKWESSFNATEKFTVVTNGKVFRILWTNSDGGKWSSSVDFPTQERAEQVAAKVCADSKKRDDDSGVWTAVEDASDA